MYRGQGARAKRTARRLLLQAGLEVPDSLKPGKAVNDLPEPEKAEAKALQKRLKELRFSRKFSTCEVEWEVSQIKGRLHELLSLEEDEEDELETAKQVNKRLLQTIEEAKEWAEQCKPPVKEEPAEGAQAAAVEPGQAAVVEPAEAPAVGEPGKADAVGEPEKADEIPTGDTEESEEEEDWQKVGEKKRRRKKHQKNTKIILSLQRLSTFLFSLQRLHL